MHFDWLKRVLNFSAAELCYAKFVRGIGFRPFAFSLKGDEQLDRPNSQTTMELCHACAA